MLVLDPELHKRVAVNEKMWSDAHKRVLGMLVAFHKQYPM